MYKFILLNLLIAICLSCHKTEADNVVPEILIMSPETGQAFRSGQTVSLQAVVKDNSLHEVSIKILSGVSMNAVYEKTFVAHDKSEFAISDSWTPSGISSPSDFTFVVKAEDHGGHLVESSVSFTVNP